MAESLIAETAEAAHRALDAVDDNWHYACMPKDLDEGPPECHKGDYARRMLEQDVMPAVLATVSEHLTRVFEANEMLLPVEALRWVQAELRVAASR